MPLSSKLFEKSNKLNSFYEPANAQHICESLLDIFATKPEELIEFNQNPEKEYEEEE